jgi:hypothetical protein
MARKPIYLEWNPFELSHKYVSQSVGGEGHTAKEIAIEYRVSVSTVRRALKYYGIKKDTPYEEELKQITIYGMVIDGEEYASVSTTFYVPVNTDVDYPQLMERMLKPGQRLIRNPKKPNSDRITIGSRKIKAADVPKGSTITSSWETTIDDIADKLSFQKYKRVPRRKRNVRANYKSRDRYKQLSDEMR